MVCFSCRNESANVTIELIFVEYEVVAQYETIEQLLKKLTSDNLLRQYVLLQRMKNE